MSLVNDMLRDLDRRHRMPSDASPHSYSIGGESSSSMLASWKLFIIITVGIVIGVSTGYVFFSSSEQVDLSTTLNAAPDFLVAGNESLQAPQSLSGIEKSVSIFEDKISDDGFVLRVISASGFSFEVVSQDDYGITVLLQDISRIAHNDVEINGVAINQFDAGVSVAIKLNDKTNYLTYEERGAGSSAGTTLVIEAAAEKDSPIDSSLGVMLTVAENTQNAELTENPGLDFDNVVQKESNEVAPPVRTARVLSFEDQDIRLSQSAAQLIQRGQMMDAYAELIQFIGNNVEAHHSRETLATLLFAQQEYEQANAIVDQGLNIAPNYSAYKRIKARLLLLNKEAETAAQFLLNYPPELAADSQYYELLATAFQQSDRYMEAIETYQNLIRHDSQQARWWVGLGVSHEAMGNVADAISSYQAALQNSKLDDALRQYSQNRIRYLKN